MFDFLWDLDKSIFISINSIPHNLLLDSIFSFFSAGSFWVILWIFLAFFYIVNFGRKNIAVLIALLVAVVLTAISVNLIFKNLFGRVRPFYTLPAVIEIGSHTSSASFPSSHATFSFAAAYILTSIHKKRGLYFYLTAFLISISRIYLGKHYPSDLIAGGLMGLLLGFISVLISKKLWPQGRALRLEK